MSDVASDVCPAGDSVVDVAPCVEQLGDPRTSILPIIPPIQKPTPAPLPSLRSNNRIQTPIVYSSVDDESDSDSDESFTSEVSCQPPIPAPRPCLRSHNSVPSSQSPIQNPRRSTRHRKLPSWFDPAVFQMKHAIEYEDGIILIPYSNSC